LLHRLCNVIRLYESTGSKLLSFIKVTFEPLVMKKSVISWFISSTFLSTHCEWAV